MELINHFNGKNIKSNYKSWGGKKRSGTRNAYFSSKDCSEIWSAPPPPKNPTVNFLWSLVRWVRKK
jgi:hypothetical protein